ncbi:UNVERIFIED_ORG: putative lipoprotein with Yx(FWY)xxD motif [Arthrobacter globiformis]|nr:putative lipoprotein with Yx(FWY)xxD motif [Arthrobacter globiformis]
MKKQLSVGLAVMALAASLTACGGGSGTTTTTSAAAPATESPAATASTSATSDSAMVDLKTASSSKGDIVVDSKGMSVYYFTKDVKDSGKSNCTGDCLVKWPPVIAATDTPKVEGVTGTVGTIDTPDGKKQVTVNGMPVYLWEKDKAPGDITGQGVGNVWYLVAPDGTMMK